MTLNQRPQPVSDHSPGRMGVAQEARPESGQDGPIGRRELGVQRQVVHTNAAVLAPNVVLPLPLHPTCPTRKQVKLGGQGCREWHAVVVNGRCELTGERETLGRSSMTSP
jgi:hypothetical protein